MPIRAYNLCAGMEVAVVPKEAKKLLENQSIGIDAQVSAYRLKQADVAVGQMGLKSTPLKQGSKISPALVKRLAGR